MRVCLARSGTVKHKLVDPAHLPTSQNSGHNDDTCCSAAMGDIFPVANRLALPSPKATLCLTRRNS